MSIRAKGGQEGDINIDGNKIGIVPKFGVELAPGRHSVRLLNKYTGLDSTESMTVTAGETVGVWFGVSDGENTVSTTMQPQPEAPAGVSPTAPTSLSDDGQIFEMIKVVMSANQAQVRSCYEERLLVDEGLAGAWKVSFVVKKSGATSGVGIEPQGVVDTEFQACLVRVISSWKFSPIVHDQPVSQTKRFGAAGP